ncbi:Hypothetical predicted protein [Octopus vulgaris]|uniref:Uncharacterized protein n=1 Tax=Octopus vulgaris TaxID=6645 RepID=A0AA36AY31_OCTVU|nr:Hypothetical predicted protein [Octopus vulgaris]
MESWTLKMLDTLVSATYENEIRSSRISDRIMTIMSRLDWNTLCLTGESHIFYKKMSPSRHQKVSWKSRPFSAQWWPWLERSACET